MSFSSTSTHLELLIRGLGCGFGSDSGHLGGLSSGSGTYLRPAYCRPERNLVCPLLATALLLSRERISSSRHSRLRWPLVGRGPLGPAQSQPVPQPHIPSCIRA